MRFLVCIGFLNGIFFTTGISIVFSDRIPLLIGMVLIALSAFVMGMFLGEKND